MGNQRIEADLTWYWTWSEGELSAPSNFIAMANAIALGCAVSGGLPSTEMDEGRLAAASRARPVSRALAQLSPIDRQVLYAAHGPVGGLELHALGKTAAVALLTPLARKAHLASHTTRSFEEWLVRLAWRVAKKQSDHLPEDCATLHGIAAQANAMLAKATRAYEKALARRIPAFAPAVEARAA
ncbi:MAG TPA: hypothetical protein VGK67_12995 [Myxococcales bacterium]|jgi:hypothetical protein